LYNFIFFPLKTIIFMLHETMKSTPMILFSILLVAQLLGASPDGVVWTRLCHHHHRQHNRSPNSIRFEFLGANIFFKVAGISYCLPCLLHHQSRMLKSTQDTKRRSGLCQPDPTPYITSGAGGSQNGE
jgi:hypothetical protein